MMNYLHIFYSFLWLVLFSLIITIMSTNMHPIIIMILMILMNILMCSQMSTWSSNHMFSILMFLILISGLLIIYMYFSSLVSNDKSTNEMSKFKLFLFVFSNFTMMNSLYQKFSNLQSNLFNMNEINQIDWLFPPNEMTLTYMYMYPHMNLTFLSIFFILLSFFTIIKINASTHSYSMRKIL